MPARELHRWRGLEAQSRRPLGLAAHPDDCPKLVIKGVEWAIPPRGTRVVPRFAGGRVALSVTAEDDLPGAAELLDAVNALREERKCRTCGQTIGARVTIDLEHSARVLELAAGLAARALLRQYELSDEELGELLSFGCDEAPGWFGQILRWAAGRPATPQPPRPAPGPPATGDAPKRRSKRPFWRFW